MSGRRITELAVATAVRRDDVLPTVDLAGTPTTKQATVGLLIADVPYLIPINARVADYVATLDDVGHAIEMDVAVANTVTIEPEATVAWPVGAVIEIASVGVGQTTVVAGVGVTINTPGTLVLTGQWSTVSLRYRGSDAWLLAGDVEAAP